MAILEVGFILSVMVVTDPPELFFHVHEIVRLFYPGERLDRNSYGLPMLNMRRVMQDEWVEFSACFNDERGQFNWHRHYRLKGNRENEARRLARVFVYQMLSVINGPISAPYGILTGIRPTKLVNRMMDENRTRDEIMRKLEAEFLMAREKAAFLCEIAEKERLFLPDFKKASERISLYIGIPYCPSRCNYCSFPSTPLGNREVELERFLDSLEREIIGVGDSVQKLGLKVENIYLGGGTPGVLGVKGMERLINCLDDNVPKYENREFSVELGRPDVIDTPLLQLLAERGINRISINPQTMNDKTLARIGRLHTSEDVYKSFAQARRVGNFVINMDVIVGLPGENKEDWAMTLEGILALGPENITVHTLALKKGSALADEEGFGIKDSRVEMGVKMFREVLLKKGYEPYYMYRQKNMRADLENTGYTLPGYACRYNIQVIEERQTVLGLGGGAASKFVDPRDFTLTSFYNPKNPEVYCESIPRLIAAKVDKLKSLNIELS